MGCSVKLTLLLESSTCPMCMPIVFCRIGQFNSCMFFDQLVIVISSSSMFAMLGMGTGPSKLW
jgi:hypothetical protein